MQIPILIEPAGERGFIARSIETPAISAEGTTKDEAERRLVALLTARHQSGWEYRLVEIPAVSTTTGAGIFKDDPTFDEWQEIIAENRRKMDLIESDW